ncbi:MAG TPA: hypothetical protein VHL79_04850 [Ramlibacter sp.]|jgi:hypothetical protein|nr:hypothetical protein [Ramlibacter sp.]
MSSGFVPLAGPALAPQPTQPARARRRDGVRVVTRPASQSVAWCVLVVAILLEVAVLLRPQALLLGPVQNSVLFKTVSGYTMLALMAFAIAFGWVRRRPAMARQHRKLNELHQVVGLAILVLLAFHAAGRPGGFLQFVLHGMAVGVAAGALRSLLGARAGRATSAALLMLHISLSFLVSAAALLHLWFVIAYTA